VLIVEAIGQRVSEVFVNHSELRVAAVVVPSGEARLHAQVFVASFAVAATAASPSQPRDANSIPRLESGGVRAEFVDNPYHFVAGDHMWLVNLQIALGDVQIGSTHSTCPHAHADFPGARVRRVPPNEMEAALADRTGLGHLPRAHAHAG
jgi:hypothetical protein